MPLSPRGGWFMRGFVLAVLCLTCRSPAPAHKHKHKARKRVQRGAMPSAPGPNYPYGDVSFLDLKAAPGQPLRAHRGIGVPAGSYDLYIVLHERAATATPAAGSAAVPPAAAGKT